MISSRHFNLKDIPLDTTCIAQSLLNIEKKERSNPFTWRGQFSPQFVQILLQAFAHKDSVILDPFAGSGTVLYEAGREKLSAFGAEINPSAYIIARTYRLINVNYYQRTECIAELDRILKNKVGSCLPLLEGHPQQENEETVKNALIIVHNKIQNQQCKELLETLIVKFDFYKEGQNLFKIWNSLKKFVMELPYSDRPLKIINTDARNLPLEKNTVDLVITSPPYINVFNYHQQYRASVEALGWNILSVAKSEMGSNRKNRGNRFLTIVEYCMDIFQVLAEIKRVSNKKARIIFVVGRESKIRNTPFYNSQIVAKLGMHCVGLKLDMRQERFFKNKFGVRIYEDVLHFSLMDGSIEDSMAEARKIACETLRESLKIAPPDSHEDIQIALNRVSDINPSPMYQSSVYLKNSNLQRKII